MADVNHCVDCGAGLASGLLCDACKDLRARQKQLRAEVPPPPPAFEPPPDEPQRLRLVTKREKDSDEAIKLLEGVLDDLRQEEPVEALLVVYKGTNGPREKMRIAFFGGAGDLLALAGRALHVVNAEIDARDE